MELRIKANTPKIPQEYEVTLEEEDEAVTVLTVLFFNGTGTLVFQSEDSLKYSTGYTITKIVGIVPSSSSTMSNGISIPQVAWPFNLASTPSFVSFTTPTLPSFSTLQAATAHIIESDPQSAFIVLLFDKEVCGSYDFVVEEEGKDVTLTVITETSSISGGTIEFKVIGDEKLLTHNTTYTIKSIVPSPGTDTLFVFMNHTITFHIPESSYVPPEEPEDPKKTMSPETKRLLSWLIPLVACLLVALVIAIIVIVLLRRRQQKPAQKELETQEPMDVEKVEDFGVDCSHGVIRTDENDQATFDPSHDHPTRVNHSDEVLNTMSRKEGELVEVMSCRGDFTISTARMDSTLYSVLHKERREIGKRGVGVQIVNGLTHVVAHRGWSDVLTHLSSHWILIDASGNVQLKLQMNASEAEQEAAQAQKRNANMTDNSEKDKSGMDDLRWRAPEVVGSGVGGQVDGHKASVFSLGLVLWEIETGQVPFGELDAMNAQRQSGTGIGPKMESLKDESLCFS
ncbi:hypothetical protein BLNAU_5046 [Blattamonas nauphoetae]|uniref:Protein kinase domain-containing protein n=1 Tax=Blattamonas nauphoetae TaxID=2049346 RepID=A0ABQ9Y836_9EUKA|nr:hypothetical protein BLNAU_5046 [Blattamonas nauphoetae]